MSGDLVAHLLAIFERGFQFVHKTPVGSPAISTLRYGKFVYSERNEIHDAKGLIKLFTFESIIQCDGKVAVVRSKASGTEPRKQENR